MPLAELHQQDIRDNNRLWGDNWAPAGCGSSRRFRLTHWKDPKQHSYFEDWIVGPRHGHSTPTGWTVEGSIKKEISLRQLEHVEQAIRNSEKILQLKDNWDEDGSPGYQLETWERAVSFVRLHCYKAWRVSGKTVPAPIVFPGPDGSIDVHWRTERFELLVNVPANPAKPATFYGDDYADICIKGTVATSRDNPGILQWLMR